MPRYHATPESWKKVSQILDEQAWIDLLTTEEIYAMLLKGDQGVTIQADATPDAADTGDNKPLGVGNGTESNID